MTASEQMPSRRFIGRAAELARLRAAAERAAAGQGECVLVSGESGIGKTRLLAELRSGWPGPVLLARCFEEDASFPLAPLQFALPRLLPGAHLAGSLQAAAQAADPAAAQRSLFEEIAAALFALAARQPLLAVFEDLHWSDESTLAFIRFLARRLPDQPVLLLATHRPTDLPSALADLLQTLRRESAADGGPQLEELTLAPFTPAEVDAMLVDFLAAGSPVAADLVDAIHTASGGNALYVEELARAMLQAGDVEQAGGRWVLRSGRGGGGVRVPASVQDALRRQAAALSPAAQRVLGVAAVAGREFHFDIVAAVTRLPEGELVGALKELIAAGLVAEERDDAFAFRHPLLREAAQAQLLSRERHALHLEVAEALERAAGTPAESAQALAHHYYEAGAWELALTYARLAAEQARRLDAIHEALRHLARGLDCAARLQLDPPLDLLLARAELYERAGEFEPASADLERARGEAERLGRPREAWAALLKLGYLWAGRDYGRSLEFLQAGLAVAETLDDPLPLAETLNRIGNVYLNRDQPAEALPYHLSALAAYEAAGDAAGQAGTYEMLAVCYYNLPDVVAGAACEERALDLGRQAGERQAVFHASIHLLLPLRFETEVGPAFEPERLVRLGEDALATARQMGWAGGEAQALGLLGGFLGLLGQYDRALPNLHAAIEMAERKGYAVGISAGQRMAAAVMAALLAFDDAAVRLRGALKTAEDAGAQLFADIAGLALCEVLAARQGPGDLDEADGLLRRLLAGQQLAGGRMGREAMMVEAELALSRGDGAAALARVEELAAGTCHLPESGMVAVPRLALLQGRALTLLGRHDEAAQALAAAVQGAAALHRRPLLWRGHAALGRLCLDLRQRRAAQEHFAQARSLIAAEAAAVPDPALREVFLRRAFAALPPPASPTERRRAKEAHAGLTEREREVVRLVAGGDSNKEIGEKLVISERTAERHVANILAKLGLHSRVQLAGWAADHLPT